MSKTKMVKMVLNFSLTVALAAMCYSMPASAQTVSLKGAGVDSCGEYLSQRADHRIDSHYIQWVWGMMSGYNFYATTRHAAQVQYPEGPTVLAYLDKFCRDNPLKTIATGVFGLI